MNPLNKVNKNWALRLLLLLSHVALFTPHCNYRYYTIANNFVYNSSENVQAESPVGAHGSELTVEHRGLHQTHTHLSMDKRFRMQVLAQHVFSGYPAPPSYDVVRPICYSSSFVYSSSGPSINILRGPPSA